MQDPIEKFIRENRSDFDHLEPREVNWERIGSRMARPADKQQWKVLLVAACMMLIMVSSFVLFQKFRTTPAEESFPQLDEAEFYYSSLIEVKRSELNTYRKTNPELYREFEKQIEALGVSYAQLKTEFKGNSDKKVVLQAMVENLQTQLDILAQQLTIINQVEKSKIKHNERISI